MIVLEILAHLPSIVRGDYPAIAEGEPLGKAIERFALVGFPLDDGAQFWIADVLKEKPCADHAPKLPKSLVQLIFVAIGVELPQDRRCRDRAIFDGEDNAQQVGDMPLNQIPVNIPTEERVDMFIATLWCRAIEREILPVADSYLKFTIKMSTKNIVDMSSS